MTTERKPSSKEGPLVGHRLVSWPLMLIGLTLALVFVANSVSAWGRRDSHDIEDVKAHAEFFIGRALDRIDATEEQSSAIQTIVMATIDDLHGARGDGKTGREEFRGLVLADSIDRAALEQFRQSQLERFDELSRIVADGLADIMDVLTPEQRQEIDARFAKHHGRHGWGWH